MNINAEGFILLTALVPTRGHIALIKFAGEYLADLDRSYRPVLNVLLCTRKKEPITGADRQFSIMQELDKEVELKNKCRIVITQIMDDNAPQNPEEDHPDFWGWWAALILSKSIINTENWFIFSSEYYGLNLAEAINGTFIPYDMNREIFSVKGTSIRKDVYAVPNFKEIIPSFQKLLRKEITIFGAESTGKSTKARTISRFLGGVHVPEWARQYLETVGPEVTEEKMSVIARGQYAVQRLVRTYDDYPIIVHDTDLLSTIGYYRIMGIEPPARVIEDFICSKSDLYILLSSEIPFEEDPLRYGGNKRQSDDQFWIDLLEEYNCEYKIVSGTDDTSKRFFMAVNYIRDFLAITANPIRDFVRE
jgi:HTH-type transcriptional repressor of NAD biosynthesis genes